MVDSREDNCRDVAQDGEDKRKINALRWYLYKKREREFDKYIFLVAITHKKGGNIVWNCVKDNIIKDNEDYKAIGICAFDYKLFEEEEGGGI